MPVKKVITADTFLDAVFSELEEGEEPCVIQSKWNAMRRSNQKWKDFIQPRRKSLNPQDWYYCVSTCGDQISRKEGRQDIVARTNENIVRYHIMVFDDIGTKIEASAIPVAPSYKMETSPGNFQWGFRLNPNNDFDRYQALLNWAVDKKMNDPGATGAARIVRVPNSPNKKEGNSDFRSSVIEWNPDRVWTLDELAEALGCELDNIPIKAPEKSEKRGGAGALEGIDPMLNWLVAKGEVIADSGGDWVDIICPNAVQHTTGDDKAGYSPLGRGTEQWVQTRGFKCMHAHCMNISTDEFLELMAGRGAPVVPLFDPIPWLEDRYAYIAMTEQVADLHQRKRGGEWIWDLGAWKKLHQGKIKINDQNVPITTAWMNSRRTIRADNTVYLPIPVKEDTGVVDMYGAPRINTYVAPTWMETDEPPQIFLDHIEFLIPNPQQRETTLDWLAKKIQEPLSRSYAICMVADEVYGLGRSWLGRMLRKTMQGKVNTATLAQLIGKGTSGENNYNDWVASCQFLIVEEAKDNIDRDIFFEGYEKFKQIVDTSVGDVRVNPKYGKTRDDKIYFNCLIFTNHVDALVLPENDRRIFVVENPIKIRSVEYYAQLDNALNSDEEARRLYWYLMHREIGAFDHVNPPMTDAKAQMIEMNASPRSRIFEWILHNVVPDITTLDSMKTHVGEAASKLGYEGIAVKPGGIARQIFLRSAKKLRAKKNGARYQIDGIQTELRSIRNHEKWSRVDEERDLEALVSESKRRSKPNPHIRAA